MTEHTEKMLDTIADLLREIRNAVVKPMPDMMTKDASGAAIEPEPNADGWMPWSGGECPVDQGALASIQLRDGYRADIRTPRSFRWDHDGSDGDIIAYKLAEPVQAPAPAETKPEAEPDFSPPPWSLAPRSAQWLVLEPNGHWSWRERPTELRDDGLGWISATGGVNFAKACIAIPPRHVWQSSRMRRPEGSQ